MKKRLHIYAYSALYIFTGVIGEAAHAQDSVLNDEIIVTANRREQKLSDVDISITAFSGEQLKDLGVTSSMDIDKQPPGLIATGYAGSITVFNIRGSGQLDFNDQQEAPVAAYVDDAYVSFLSGVGFSFFDLDHVEVLRGAQGTLFGRNATAGVVHFVSRKPTDMLNGYAELTLSEYGGRRAEGAIGGPIADGLNGRLSLYYDRNHGFVKTWERSTGMATQQKISAAGRRLPSNQPTTSILTFPRAGRPTIRTPRRSTSVRPM